MEINQWLSACDVIGEQAKKRGVKIETITDLRCSVYTTPAVFTGNLRLRGHGSRLVLQIENMHNRSNGLAHDGFAVVDLDAVVAIEPEFHAEED